MPLKFKNTDVEAAYESDFNGDPQITIQGFYSGKLSNITFAVAQKLIALKDNLVREKQPAKPAAETAKVKPPPATEKV